MEQSYTNICASCRKAAHMTQEQWAECLHVSVDTVKGWERNLRIPSNYHVCLMIDLCGEPWYAYKHLLQTSDCLRVLPDTPRQPLPVAVIRLVNRIIGFADRNRDKQLLQIAEDGVIDEKERPTYDEIVRELNEIIGAAYSLRYAEGTPNG
nr:MAG TPA: putative transcriptional regulator [Caudoviricetes sp.]